MATTFHRFGIRHHGPGCARALAAALRELRPDVVVIEGPADAEDAIAAAGAKAMRPPVAMLVYPVDEPREASYYPLAEFSPEWVALRWAIAAGVPVRLMDLPLALRRPSDEPDPAEPDRTEPDCAEPDCAEPDGAEPDGAETDPGVEAETADEPPPSPQQVARADPLALLSQAAGFADPELWWEQQIERHRDAANLFAGIEEAMTAIREAHPEERRETLDREAFMRKTVRAIAKELKTREAKEADDATVAIVCGAWHLPALSDEAIGGRITGSRIKDDTARLKGWKRRKTAATWIPWTTQRLTFASGYGAGITSPGWYRHLWNTPDDAPTRWIVEAARLMRSRDLDASSASVIDAVRTADTLASLRGLRAPGLAELREAILAVLCRGNPAPLELIRRHLEVGDRLGEVPDDTPTVPLAQDLTRLQRSLRMKPTADAKSVTLDLRTDSGRDRSHLLHRLDLLGIPWGEVERSGGRRSTFAEAWTLRWKPEFAVCVIEANIYGSTVRQAAVARMLETADRSDPDGRLPMLTDLVERSLLAGLSEVTGGLLDRIRDAAAAGHNVRDLLAALPPLAQISRYGDVRGTAAGDVESVLVGLFDRALVGLESASRGLDDDAAARLIAAIDRGGEAIRLVGRDDLRDRWHAALCRLIDLDIHPQLIGRCLRLLIDAAAIPDDAIARRTRRALSVGNDPSDAAAWASGLLAGPGLVLLHQRGIWQAFDAWVRSLGDEAFETVLPLMRRAFADFTGPERRQMGQLVRDLEEASGGAPSQSRQPTRRIDADRAAVVMPTLRLILSAASPSA